MHVNPPAISGTGGEPGRNGTLPPAVTPHDREQFASLLAEAAPALRAIAAGVLGRPGQVDDVIQEAALVGLQKFNSFQQGTCFGAWMGKIVRFTALNTARRGQRSDRRTIDPEVIDHAGIEASPPPADIAFDRSGRFSEPERLFDDLVMRALDTLEERQRVCLLMRVLHDMPYREISRVLDIPEGTAMSHVHRARATLRDLLRDHETSGEPSS